ncbi:sulfatase-like hydrolase/transferase [Paenibacillus sp. 1P07SE]|uniref:sulfatase-like hydrolase/transferase n=1 Tax=Paenibacillus sp. 1P07SE TaxID=3132209 RepID=UPI0039A685E0
MKSKKPNILLFMTDQQHVETVGKSKLCRTPRIDALMEQSVVFSNAYTNCPMCTPARTSAMTGLHPHQHLIIQNAHSKMAFRNKLDPEVDTIGDAMQEQGYTTVQAGKWHIGDSQPQEHGFRHRLQLRSGPQDTGRTDRILLQDRYGEHTIASTQSFPAGESEVFRLAESVNDWLDGYADEAAGEGEKQPFFMFASCIEPHVPWNVPEPYASMYDPAELEEWDNYRDDYAGKPMTFAKHYYDVNFLRIRNDWPMMAKALAKYYGMVTMIDDAFGLILDKLEARGLLDDTIILFTSDHGEMMGRHGLIGKNELLQDDLIRIPFLAYAKGQFPPRTVPHPLLLTDLFNTILELAGGAAREQLDSLSFAPLLRGGDQPPRAEVVMQHHGATINLNVIRGIRTERYKYVFRPHEIDEFYDLAEDPWERNNRIGDPQVREVIWELRERLLAWAKRTADFAHDGMQRSFANPEAIEFQTEGRLVAE